jgi:hypothetical protein
MDLWSFLTSNFLFFSLGVMAFIFVVRTALEYFFPKLKTLTIWNNLVLPTAPVLIGGIMAFFLKAYPYSTGTLALTSPWDHILFGAIAGLLSGLIFRVIKGLLGQQIQTIVSSLGIPLPPAPPTSSTTSTPPSDAPPPNR